MSKSGFTVKSMLFGLLGLLIVCFFPAYSEKALGMNNAVKGYLPIVPLFLVVFLSLFWNMILGRIWRGLAFNAKELAVVFGLMLMVAWIPSLQQALVRNVVLTRYEEMTTNVTWQEAEVTARLPDRLFPRAGNGDTIGEDTHFGMIQGGVALGDIPFAAWTGPILAWMPLLILLPLCLMALTFIVHRQWTLHEQLRYPLASIVDALIRQDPKKVGGAIFRNRLFWSGFAFVFGLFLLRYLHAWFPSNVPAVPSEYALGWNRLFPSMDPSNARIFLLNWMPVSFAIIGIAFFVPTDVSLSMGITAPLGTFLGIQYYLLTGDPVSSGDLDIFRAGGFIAFGIILAYTGRSYYFPILRKALFAGQKGTEADPGGVWAARVFLSAYVALILVMTGMGVDLLMSWIIVTFMLLIFLVVTRLVCETGVPFIIAGWSLPSVLSGLLGSAAIGAGPLMFLTFLSSTIIPTGSSQLVMPYMATSLKLLDDNDVNLKRFAVASKIAILVALVAGFGGIIMLAYTHGTGNLLNSERGVWNQGVRQVLSMIDFGQYEASEAARGFGKLSLIRPDGATLGLVFSGLIVVVGCYMMRFRFAKWPLHPLFFVVLGTSISNMTWSCFLLGWVIKTLVVKVGGGRAYNAVKPLFIGFIMGEFLGIALMFIVGLIYHWITGNQPVSMWML